MVQLVKITSDNLEPRSIAIFLHGLGGDLYGTWRLGDDPKSFWPRWLGEDIESVAVYLLGYEAPISRWRGVAMHLPDRAMNLLARLLSERELQHGKIILIGHSLGGLVIKQLMRTANSEAQHRIKAAEFVTRIEKVVFLATPHAGSGLATLGDRLRFLVRPSAATACLVRNDPHLRDLNNWYRNWAHANGIPHLILTETKPMRVLGMVVKPDSSDLGLPGSTPVPVDADHWTVCKPANRTSDIYVNVRAFIERAIEPTSAPGALPRSRFDSFAAQRDALQARTFPSKALAVSNIPIRIPTHFLGRDDALEAIKTALKSHEGRVAITALHGMRGVGKTTLAAAYAERHRSDYRAAWWIRANTEQTTRADLVALGVRLGWVTADEKEVPAFAAVMERLQHEGEGILFIFDNASDSQALKPFLPRGTGTHVLVTSNAHAWRGVAALLEIRVWPMQIGADYLIACTGREGERDAALALSEALGGLPLAHAQAASYCERLDVSLAEYRKRYDAAPARLLDDMRHAPAEYHERLTVAKTFALAIQEAAKLHPAAEPLIVHAALLAPEPIPLFLFAEGRIELGEPLAGALACDGLDEALAALRTFALIDREVVADEREPAIRTECIRLHRLVRQVAAARREGEAQEEARRALIVALEAVYPAEVYSDPKTWPRARQLDALVLALLSASDPLPRAIESLPKGIEKEASSLLDGLATFRHRALAAYSQARTLYESGLAIREKVLGLEHPDTATSLDNLAGLLRDQGDLAGARTLLTRAREIREKVLGPEHPHTATSVNNLAGLLQAQGDLAGARTLFERALAIGRKVFGPEHPNTATTLSNLAGLLQAQGDFAGARTLFEQALAIREKVLGPEHPDTAGSFGQLASLLRARGDLVGARLLYERALAINAKLLGPAHPDTNRTRSSLARLLIATEPTEALALAEAALAAHGKVLGARHPSSKESARVTADAFDALGRTHEAAAVRERHDIAQGEEEPRPGLRPARLPVPTSSEKPGHPTPDQPTD